jgi:hypothetical protein
LKRSEATFLGRAASASFARLASGYPLHHLRATSTAWLRHLWVSLGGSATIPLAKTLSQKSVFLSDTTNIYTSAKKAKQKPCKGLCKAAASVLQFAKSFYKSQNRI